MENATLTGIASPAAWVLSPEDIPNIDDLVLEDGKPMDNIFAEKQQRLLVDPLRSSWAGPTDGREYLVLANVGLFRALKQRPLAPDVMLSIGVPAHRDLTRKENRSYLVWEMGKPPNVVVELVSDKTGGEATTKYRDYADIGVHYYVIFDPQNRLEEGLVRAFSLRDGAYHPIEVAWLPGVELGMTLWEGQYEGQTAQWLRWCDRQGVVIPTGKERADREQKRAETAEQRADRLAAQLRALGHEPEA
jgi:Uma2 family endonuclease